MLVSDVRIGNLLFEDEGDLIVGKKCLVLIAPYTFMIGIFHCYNTEEYCFKECTYYKKNHLEIQPWIDHALKPICWVSRHDTVWCKSTVV